jgi:magnesium transporter
MSEIVEALDDAGRQRVADLRRAGAFFWADICLQDLGAPEEIGAALDIPEHALRPLLSFGHEGLPSEKFHADLDHVVFPFHCYLESPPADGEEARILEAIEVNVLVHGDYLLTLHRERATLPELLPSYSAEGRSEQYVVYAVLDGMVATAFDALNSAELALEGLQTLAGETRNARVRAGTLRAINVRLTRMRRRLGPQRGRFERIGQEIGQVRGLVADNERYFERIYAQLNRLIDGIDAASNSMTQLMDMRLNETIYWLTVVATIFLPLTFMTGFFGMNFEWMVTRIDTPLAFLALGIGGPLASTAVIWLAIRRRATPVQPDQDALERLVATVRRPLRQLPPIL